MNSFNKKIGYLNDNFKIFHIRDKKELNFDYHHHDFNKIIILVSGNVKYWVEGKTYTLKPWDVLFIKNSELHKPIVDATKFYERIVVWVKPNINTMTIKGEDDLLECFSIVKNLKNNLVTFNSKDLSRLKGIVSQIGENRDNDNFGKESLQYALFLQLMVHINRAVINCMDCLNQSNMDFESHQIVNKVIEYINENIENDLSINTLASEFYLTRYTIARYFKGETGKNLHEYIIKKRLAVAKELIRDGFSMKIASQRSGFKDYSTFVRAFKREYKLSPSEYAKQMKV